MDQELPSISQQQASATKQEDLRHALKGSTWIKILHDRLKHDPKLPLNIAFLDIDSTLTGDNDMMEKVLIRLQEKGYTVFLVTNRGEETLVSNEEYDKRPLHRLRAKMRLEHQKESPLLRDPAYVAGVAGSTGSAILYHQVSGGYREDEAFRARMKAESHIWRETVLKVIEKLSLSSLLSDLEYPEKYETGENDITPPDFRIALDLPKTKEDGTRISKEENQKKLITHMHELRAYKSAAASEYAKRTHKLLVEDSVEISNDLEFVESLTNEELRIIQNLRIMTDSEPAINHFNIILTPNAGSKNGAVAHIIQETARQLHIHRSHFDHILISGDSLVDLKMGLIAARVHRPKHEPKQPFYGKSNIIYFIPFGSRLTEVLEHLAGGDIASEIMFSGTDLSPYAGLEKTSEEGIYTYKLTDNMERITIINSTIVEDFRDAGSPPESLLILLEKLGS